jgi:hypothetical protein
MATRATRLRVAEERTIAARTRLRTQWHRTRARRELAVLAERRRTWQALMAEIAPAPLEWTPGSSRGEEGCYDAVLQGVGGRPVHRRSVAEDREGKPRADEAGQSRRLVGGSGLAAHELVPGHPQEPVAKGSGRARDGERVEQRPQPRLVRLRLESPDPSARRTPVSGTPWAQSVSPTAAAPAAVLPRPASCAPSCLSSISATKLSLHVSILASSFVSGRDARRTSTIAPRAAVPSVGAAVT